MIEYKPKAPNELADKQLKREKYESEKSKAAAKHYYSQEKNIDNPDAVKKGDTNKESYNTIPGK
ncbi:MAG: hypothetical protein ABS944_11095 [Solibacillus sp.]|uniref:hypothetical protein n=1 Tax=unclassified Solibacillus TaxID=2637870 RepID=UPI0030F4DAA4